MKNKETVRTFLNGFNDKARLQESLDFLAEDYKFKNPMVELNSKAEFIPLAKSIADVLTEVEIVNLAAIDDWVAVSYIFKTQIPGVEINPATEWFRIENDLIQESHLIYDASEWRKVYANMK